MIVCVCHAVNDRRIREAIERGARSVSDVARQCRAGTDCGACCPNIRDMVEAARSRSTTTGGACSGASLGQ